jgi:hypothetical protein
MRGHYVITVHFLKYFFDVVMDRVLREYEGIIVEFFFLSFLFPDFQLPHGYREVVI